MEPTIESKYAALLKNAALTHGIISGVSALTIAVAGGIVARAPWRGLFVGLGSQAVALLAAFAVSLLLLPIMHPISTDGSRTIADELWLPLLFHASLWALMGALCGAAFTLGMGMPARVREAVLYAMAGGVIAAVCFQMLAACSPIDAGANLPIARWPVIRFTAVLVPTVLIAVGVVLGTETGQVLVRADQGPGRGGGANSPTDRVAGSPM